MKDPGVSRRRFLSQSAAVAASYGMISVLAGAARPGRAGDTIHVGLVGCGGRGTGAAAQALRADPNTKLVAIGDAFGDRVEAALKSLRSQTDIRGRVAVEPAGQCEGFDAYRGVIGADVDVVLLTTPPHFRPVQLKACVEAGKHVFAEKPVAVDAPGVRSVLETTQLAGEKGLTIVSGLNSRYSPPAQEMVQKIHEGAVGDLVALHTARYGSGVWVRPREPGMTEMEYQMRNWYYFTWLSGDFNVEQFVHQLDRMAWVMQDQYPVRCYSTGGRQARSGDDEGHIYDHFSSVFEYANGVRLFSTTRHQRGCTNETAECAMGTRGTADLRNGTIRGAQSWRQERRGPVDSHQLEQNALFAALRRNERINNGVYMAKSTLMAIMSRQSAYTGQTLTWEEILNSQEDLSPSGYAWDAEPPPARVAVPGVTRFT